MSVSIHLAILMGYLTVGVSPRQRSCWIGKPGAVRDAFPRSLADLTIRETSDKFD
ncbi:MAG: hypothetical protein JWR58_5177 [Pseudonocardia sp.]|jgi:hypothetical protein|nr:hypothetical protein [Pseudonocardia sp.]